MSRRPIIHATLSAAAGLLASVALAAPAQASISIASFSLKPSTTQAGGSSNQPGPDLALNARFSTTDGDTPKDATLALASGLLANPSGVPLCSTQDFQNGSCPASSRIGHGTTTGTAPQFGLTLSLPTDVYLIQPQGSEPARVGLIVTFFDYPIATESGPVTIRTSPDVGIDIPLSGLPNQLDGTPVIINGLHLTIFGSVGGQPFTRNPTSCSAAMSTLTTDSYGSSTELTKTSSFTPTGCDTLPYTPTIAGSVAKDSVDDGIALQATVTQQYDEADHQSIELTFPFSASPRLSAFANACTNADISTCPSVGTATVTTPLLSSPLNANVVLVAHSGALPTVAILVPQPFGIELDATPILTGSSVQALVANIPDIPISSLVLNLPGGPDSLFRAGVHLCTDPQSWGGQFTAWSGATATPSAPATVTGCPGSSASPPTPTSAPQRAAPVIASGSPSESTGSTGLARIVHGHLTVVVSGGRRLGRLRSVTLKVASGARVLNVKLDGHRVSYLASYANGRLTLSFDQPGRVAIITLSVRRAGDARSVTVHIHGASGKNASLLLHP